MERVSTRMKPLRVAMICDMIPGQAGGSYISTVRFAERLRARGHHVIIVAATEHASTKVSEYRGIPIYQFFSLPIPGSNRYYFQSFPTRSALKKLFIQEQIQIVHIMFTSYSCSVAKRVAKSLTIPLVAHIHTQPENISIFFPRFLRKAWVDRLVLRYLVHFVKPAVRIICPSKLGESIYHALDSSLPITVLSNGIDLVRFTNKPVATHSTTKTKTDLQIMCVARLTKDKDPETLVRAMPEIVRALPETNLVLVGNGPLKDDLEKLTYELGISDHVTFTGKLSDADLLSAYHSSDLFVLPSHVELEGMVVLEAMACGLPILIADAATSASRYFVQNNGLLFSPGNSKDLAAKAIEILRNDILRDHMRTESIRQVRYYDIERSTETLEQIYVSVLETKS